MRLILFILMFASMLHVQHTEAYGQFRHPRHVISGAGGRMSSSSVKLEGTLTQTSIGYVGKSATDSAAHLGFWYPVVVSKEIDTTTLVLLLPDMKVKTGDIIDIPIRQENGRWPYGRKPEFVRVSIAFNGSVLQPLEPKTSCPPSGFCTVNITAAPASSDGIIGSIKCKVKLGDAEETPLRIAEVTWPPKSRVRTLVRHGNLVITDICRQGDSTRLIIAGEATRLLPARPQPATAVIDLHYSLAGRTPVVLALVDVAGNTIAELLQDQQNAGEYSLQRDISGVSAGKYFVMMKTNDGTFMQPLMIVR